MSRIKVLSKKSAYYIDKRTFYHTYYFALGYNEWKEQYASMIGSAMKAIDYNGMPHGNETGDPTARIGMRTYAIKTRIDAIESIAVTAGQDLWQYLLYGVTHEKVTFEYLHSERCPIGKIPCERTKYYQMRRVFYYLLSKKIEELSILS